MSSNLQIFQSWLYKEYSDDVPNDIIYYRYENGYPHHGTGAWVNF